MTVASMQIMYHYLCSAMQFITKIIIFYVLVDAFECIQDSGNRKYKRATSQNRHSKCILPSHPEFGRWNIYDDDSSELSPGQRVPPRTVLEITCQENYTLDSSDEFYTCIRGKWTPRIGKCLRTCSTLHSTALMRVNCKLGGNTLDSCGSVVDGTVAQFQCAPFYEVPREREPYRLCSNGSWVGNLPTCVPVCGKPYNDRTLIVGGSETKKGDYPWQVALYRATDKELLCGGSLLNQRVIVTAAHCITDDEGNLQPEQKYIVAAGKYHRKYNHSKDKDAQFCSVHKMFIPRQYKASLQNYRADIALIVTKNPFTLSENVQPVCVVWQESIHETLTDPDRTKDAYVSGWGYTVEFKKVSPVLKHLKVPLVSEEECTKRLSPEDLEFFTDDKICAGYINSSSSACKGDSGGGLVTLYENRYHIIGIVSISPRGSTAHGGCDSQHFTLYTKFSEYIDKFIYEQEARFRPNADYKVDDSCSITVTNGTPPTITPEKIQISPFYPKSSHCVLPLHPRFGKWIIPFGFDEHQTRSSVPSGTTLEIECDSNFTLIGPNELTCENGTWSDDVTQCTKICPSLFDTPTTKVTCSYNNAVIEDCTQAVEGTIAKFRCSPFYENPQLENRPFRICTSGTWDEEQPYCQAVCGKLPISSTNSTLDEVLMPRNYPWQVALFAKYTADHFFASGTLLSRNIVLTAAHVITDADGQPYPARDLTLAAGMMYTLLNDSRETYAQYSKVRAVFIFGQYRGIENVHQHDIAILVAKEAFVLSSQVLPVCLDVGQNYKYSENQELYYALWATENTTLSNAAWGKKLSSLSLSACRDKTAERYKSILTSDKLCGRLLNEDNRYHIHVGSGVMQKQSDRYYVVGVTSWNVDDKSYNYSVIVYTDVSQYIDFIVKYIAKYT